MRIFGRKKRRVQEASAAAWRALERRRELQTDLARAWKASGEQSPERIREAYEERRRALPRDLDPYVRPIAAWHLREGDPGPLDSYVGGFPALVADEPWPDDRGTPMRFWAQVNLADLAPYAQAYEIAMPHEGVVQLWAEYEGDQMARYVPPDNLDRLAIARELPDDLYWDDSPEVRGMLHTSLLIDLYPEALLRSDHPGDLDEGTTSGVLPGYSFGWWSFDPYPLESHKQYEWPEAPDPPGWTFLAVCSSQRDLGLMWGDAGDLWAAVPTHELADGDFTHLHCDGESS